MTATAAAGRNSRRLGPKDLGPAFRAAFPHERFIVVSNREPYEHTHDEASGELIVRRPAGGLISALDPLMQAVGGVWVAWAPGQGATFRRRIGKRIRPRNARPLSVDAWITEHHHR